MVSPKGRADYFEQGDWNAACYECGRKRKASQMKKHWQGYYVCPEHWEPRHPQDFVRAIADNPTPAWQQDQADILVAVCTWQGRQGVAGYGIAGCMIAGYATPDFQQQGSTFQQGALDTTFILDQSVLS